MNRFVNLAVFCALLAAAPAVRAEAGQTVINSDYGTLTIASYLQGLFVARFDGSDIDRRNADGTDAADDIFVNNHYDFSLQRARLVLKGTLLSPNFTYLFQGDATLAEFALDARLGFVIPEADDYSTTIFAGRFLPAFTLVLPRAVTRLDAINYPLYVFSAQGGARQPFATGNTTGRQAGVMIEQKLTSMVTIDLGVFNGFQRRVETTWTDDNDWKDFLVHIAVRPVEGLTLGADYWAGFPNSLDAAGNPFAISATDAKLEHDLAHFAVFEAMYTGVENLVLEGEFAYTHQTIRTMDGAGVRSEAATDGLAFWVHGGYTFADLLAEGMDMEVFGRLDYFDPNIDMGHNGQMRVTLGPQFFLEGIHAQVRLNYLLNILDNAVEEWGDMRHEIWLQAAFEI